MIIFLYGEDTFHARARINELKSRFLKEIDSMGDSLTFFNNVDFSLEKFNAATDSASLFAKKRMIIVENIFATKNKTLLEKLLVHLSQKAKSKKPVNTDEDNIIIFWQDTSDLEISTNKLFKFLSTQKYVYNLKKLNNTEVASWIKKEVEKRGGKINQAAVLRLGALFTNNLWRISNEIDKLISYKNEVKDITIDVPDIDMMARGDSDANIFALTDAIGNNNKAEALRLLEQEIEAGATEQQVMSMIQRQFRILLQIKQSLDQQHTPRKIMSELKLHPFVVQKGMDQVRNFSLPVLKKTFHSLVKIDRQMKTGQSDFKSALDVLLAKI